MHCIRLIFKWKTVFLLQQFLHHKLLNSRDPQRFLCCLIYHLGGDEKNYGPCQPFIINSQTKQEFCLTIRFNLLLRFKIKLSQTNGAFFFPWLSDMKIFNLFLFLWSVLCVQDISSSEGRCKVKTNLTIIILQKGMFTNEPGAQFWPQILGNLGGFAKLGHFGHFGYFGHQRETLWPLGQEILPQIPSWHILGKFSIKAQAASIGKKVYFYFTYPYHQMK